MLSVPWTTEFLKGRCMSHYYCRLVSHQFSSIVTPWYRVLQLKVWFLRNRQTCGYGHLEVVKIALKEGLCVCCGSLRVMIMLYHPMSHTCVKLEKYWGEMTGGITQNVPKLKFVEQRQLCWCLSPETFINQKWASWFDTIQKWPSAFDLKIWYEQKNKMRNSTEFVVQTINYWDWDTNNIFQGRCLSTLRKYCCSLISWLM